MKMSGKRYEKKCVRCGQVFIAKRCSTRFCKDRECVNAKAREKAREKRANDPEYRARENAKKREKRANDPEYRERENAKALEKVRQKRANDPEYRERVNAKARENRKRK